MFFRNLSVNESLSSQSLSTNVQRLDSDISLLLRDILKSGSTLRIRVTGDSMSPFLSGGETLSIRKVSASTLRLGDLIFFRSREGFTVLHRIVRKKRTCQNSYIFQTKGDALRGMDSPVCADDIIGKVCTVEKIYADGNKIYIDMESLKWKSISYMLAVFGFGKAAMFSASHRFRCAIRHISGKAVS